jgi:hypothetical protein
MSSSAALPQKGDVAKEIWRLASTLSEEMQNAAVKKGRELGFDLDKGRIPLHETLNNLSHNRDILLEAADKNKLSQLPLKLQYTLHSQTQKISEALNSLVSGTDSVLSLEDSVEDLRATVWQYNLHNLSNQVLGFHRKMNELKSQETVIRQARREAEDFEASTSRARELLRQMEELAKASGEQGKSIQGSAELVSTLLAKVAEQEQKVTALTLQGQQQDSAATQYAASAKAASAEVEAIAARTKASQVEIDSARSQLIELVSKVEQFLIDKEKVTDDSLKEFQTTYSDLSTKTEAVISGLQVKLTSAIGELTDGTKEEIESLQAATQKRVAEFEKSISQLSTETSDRFVGMGKDYESKFTSQIKDLVKNAGATDAELRESSRAKLTEITEQSDKLFASNEKEHKRLVTELDLLEERIRESVERATGYTLFHSFQKRQFDLAKSKKFWGIALASAVGVSLIASGVFIYSLRFVQVYNAAFYLKLSISLPLIYAIAFCSVQYSRERRLEEEYAFKSSISISLEPYQKLVEQLIDKEKPEERAKYTQFIIESVNRVFTSPTGTVFDDLGKDKNSAERIIKAVGDVIDPLAKALRK